MDLFRNALAHVTARWLIVACESGFEEHPIAAIERIRQKRRYQIGLLLAFALIASTPSARAADGSPSSGHCAENHCGLLTDGAYANMVVGRLDRVGTAKDISQVFRWAKTHSYWKNLPASLEPYLRDVQLVTIAVPKGKTSRPVTLFMLQSEYASAPYHVGDLVRYAPHNEAHEEAAQGGPDDLALFHGLTGCVATLCQKGDAACFKRYRQGAFTTAHGQQVDPATGHVLRDGAQIDPVSLLPVH